MGYFTSPMRQIVATQSQRPENPYAREVKREIGEGDVILWRGW